jgi:hypothetical protein
MLKITFFLVVSLVGCTSFKEDTRDTAGTDFVGDEDADGAADGDSDGDADGGGSPTCERPHYGLQDLSSSLGEWDCDIQHATGVAGVGATSYFYGVYKDTSGGFAGFEEWILFANETWRAEGGYDCVMRWNVTAVSGDPETCPACDVALDVLLTLDEGCSTCPQDMIDAQEKSTTTRYEVQRSADGTSRWFYAGSGTEIGGGKTNSSAMNFVSDDSCVWF